MPRDSCKSKTYCWKKEANLDVDCFFCLFFFCLLFSFLFFSSFVYFLSLHTLSAQTYLITFWLQGFHDFFLIVFFLPVSLKKIMISWYSWFFLTVSMLILHGPSFLFQMRFRGDGFSIHIYDALMWCKVFSICCWCKSQIFLVGDFSNQVQPLAAPVSVPVQYWPDLRSVCPLSQFLDYSI